MQNKSFNKPDSICFTHTVSHERTTQYALHSHAFYEVYFFVDGDVHYRIEEKSYRPEPGSILLIPANAFHGVKIHSDQRYERYSFHFLPEILSPEYRKTLLAPFHLEFPYIKNAAAYHIKECGEFLMECNDLPENLKQIAISCRTEALLTQICHMCEAGIQAQGRSSSHYCVTDIITYVNNHLTEDISLSSVMEHFLISKSHLNLLFKQATGTTMGNYVTYKRVALAGLLLLEGHSTANAALGAGFRDYSTFYRAFKRIYGCSPSESTYGN